MTLRLYNTLTRTKDVFEPLAPGRVGIYLCGPTVYKPSHLGHAVGPIIFDVLKRYLTYKGFAVRFVVNITDVDDKLIAEAAARGTTVPELAKRVEENYLAGIRRLGIRSIDHMPRASEHIQEIIDSIAALIDRGCAYAAEGDVYFDVAKDPDYGKLSNRKPEELLAGTREELITRGKRNAGDFALWKAAKPGEPPEVTFDSPWGPGRPGWHIECSAMSMKYLGETFDIHGGGMELIFPHHENEIAQSECMNGKPFARFWLHHGLTRFNTKKISKSDADMQDAMAKLTLSSVLDELGPEPVRFMVLQSHYRSPLDFSDTTVAAARQGIQTFYRLFERIERLTGRSAYGIQTRVEQARDRAKSLPAQEFMQTALTKQLDFLRDMDDDLNTAAAIGVLFETATAANRFIEAAKLETQESEDDRAVLSGGIGTLLVMSRLLGLFEEPPPKARAADDETTARLLNLLVDVRRQAREIKQFALADHIRKQLAEIGFVLEDRAGGTDWRREP